MLELFVLLLGALRAVRRGRADLAAEHLLLRHQLAVLTRPGRKRPPLCVRDKLVWILARRLCTGWRGQLVLVRPETVVRWQRRAGGCSGGGSRALGSAGRRSAPKCGS